MNSRYMLCPPGEDRGNPFDAPGPDMGDDDALVQNEIWAADEYDTENLSPVHNTFPMTSPGVGSQHRQMNNSRGSIHKGLTSISNPNASMRGCRYNLTNPEDEIDPREPRSEQTHQMFDGPQVQDTVTVWVPGADETSRGRCCCGCKPQNYCWFWVTPPALVMLVGISMTAWVWTRHGSDIDVMSQPTIATCVLLGPLLTLSGLVGIFIACIVHEVRSRRRYDPLHDPQPTEEFL